MNKAIAITSLLLLAAILACAYYIGRFDGTVAEIERRDSMAQGQIEQYRITELQGVNIDREPKEPKPGEWYFETISVKNIRLFQIQRTIRWNDKTNLWETDRESFRSLGVTR